MAVYRARHGGQPVGVVRYADRAGWLRRADQLLVGCMPTGPWLECECWRTRKRRVLGDAIDEKTFTVDSGVCGPLADRSTVGKMEGQKDGGAFDQFTGATITPRAVVKATHKFLEYVQTPANNCLPRRLMQRRSASLPAP